MFFVVEDGYNTSYISALIVGLFYEKSNIERIVLTENSNINGHETYLQKLIKYKFVDNMRNNISVQSNILNEIRNYAYLCGWKITKSIDELMCQHDVIDFLSFLLSIFNVPYLEVNGNNCQYITLDNPNLGTLTKMYNNWCNTNIIENIPPFVIFKINRDISKMEPVDIMSKIKLFNSNHVYCDIKWIFHCAICKNTITNINYCILTINEKLYIWDEKQYPNLSEINLSDQDITYKIKTETYCVVYRRYTSI